MPPSASGKFVLRIAPEVHGRLRDRARRLGVSLNAYCSEMLAKGSDPVAKGPALAPGGAASGLIQAVLEVFGERIQGVALFGSAARGELRQDSDFDLLLALHGPIDRALYRTWEDSAVIASAARTIGREVSPQFVADRPDPKHPGGIWLECALEGHILYDRNGELARQLGDLRRSIAEGRFRRAYSHGHPYWIHLGET